MLFSGFQWSLVHSAHASLSLFLAFVFHAALGVAVYIIVILHIHVCSVHSPKLLRSISVLYIANLVCPFARSFMNLCEAVFLLIVCVFFFIYVCVCVCTPWLLIRDP